MANKKTEWATQYLANLALDTSVNPPIWRIGLLGKADDGAYYALKSDTGGRFQTVIMAEDANSEGTFRAVQGMYDTNGKFVLMTSGTGATGSQLSGNRITMDGSYRITQDDSFRILQAT